MAGQVTGHRVDGVGEIFPSARNARHVGLSTEPAFAADFARHARHFTGEPVQLVHHRVQRFFELQDFSADVHRDLARKVAARNGSRHFRDVSHLARQVAGHEVHVIRQVLPRAAHAGHLRLTAEFSFRAHFASHARHFSGERVQLVHHRVDGVFQLENFALHVHGDFAREVAACHGRSHFRNVAHLRGQVAGHRVDRVREVLPRSRHARHDRLPPQLSVRTNFARHARHFRCERPQLIHHRVDGFLQLQNFTADVHRNLARKIAARHCGCYFCDVADLTSQVAGHGIDRVREVLPCSRHAGHLRLSAKFSIGSHFARHARHFRSENAELLNHRVHDCGRAKEFALKWPAVNVQLHRLRQIAFRHGRDGARHLRCRAQQIIYKRVNRNFHFSPSSLGKMETHSLSRSPFLSYHLSDAL